MRARGAIALVLAFSLWCTATALATGSAPNISRCRSVRLNQVLKPDPHGLFGAFSVTAQATTCSTARDIARRYAENPFSAANPKHRTKRLKGWTCTWKPNLHVAQRVSVRCTKASARIAFAYEIPSG
jgi:hypothetical protein